MEELSDSELIRRYLSGEEAPFEVLYRRHRKRLYGYLNHLLPDNPAEADEIFQLTWIRVIDQLKHYREQGYFPAWLLRVAYHILVDRFRKEKQNRRMTELDREDMPEIPAPAGGEPWRMLDESELGMMIRKAVSELSKEQQEVFWMRSSGGLPFKEIAGIQHCSINTVLARMQYALKHLRNRLGDVDKGGLIR